MKNSEFTVSLETAVTGTQSCVIEPAHDKTNKVICEHSKDSDQSGHPPSLISLCCSHEEALGPQLPIECTAKTLIRGGGCPG